MPASASNPRVTQALASMKMLLGAGLPIHKVFRGCADVAGHPWRANFLKAADLADKGETFNTCMEELRPVLPFTERVILVIAWDTGRMDDILPKIIKRRENLHETVRKFQRSMIQPTLTLLLAALVVPGPRVLLGKITPEQYVVEAMIPLLLAAGVVLAIWMVIRMRSLQMSHQNLSDPPAPTSVLDRVMFALPLLHQMQKYGNTREFCDLLGNLLHSGVKVDEALNMTAVGLPNGLYRQEVAGLAESARGGDELHDTLKNSRLWPMGFVDMVNVADISGNTETVLLARSDIYREEYDRSVRTLGTAISWAFYGLVCMYIIYHIFVIAFQYVALIQSNIPKGMG